VTIGERGAHASIFLADKQDNGTNNTHGFTRHSLACATTELLYDYKSPRLRWFFDRY